jgi:hypothetical protein
MHGPPVPLPRNCIMGEGAYTHVSFQPHESHAEIHNNTHKTTGHIISSFNLQCY